MAVLIKIALATFEQRMLITAIVRAVTGEVI